MSPWLYWGHSLLSGFCVCHLHIWIAIGARCRAGQCAQKNGPALAQQDSPGQTLKSGSNLAGSKRTAGSTTLQETILACVLCTCSSYLAVTLNYFIWNILQTAPCSSFQQQLRNGPSQAEACVHQAGVGNSTEPLRGSAQKELGLFGETTWFLMAFVTSTRQMNYQLGSHLGSFDSMKYVQMLCPLPDGIICVLEKIHTGRPYTQYYIKAGEGRKWCIQLYFSLVFIF